jgi:putative hemolysin
MLEVTKHTIDVNALLKSKMGNKANKIPKFIVNWLQRIIHQDEVNSILWDNKDLSGIEWVDSILNTLKMNVEVKGIENLPPANNEKRYTFCSNHPLGGPDGLLIAQLLGHQYNDNIRLLVNDLLLNLPGLAPLCVPVNTVAHKSDRGTSEAINKAFNDGYNMFFFPAGLCSRKIDGKIQDLPWTKTFLVKSIQYKRDIVPMHISGRNSDRFYRIASLCKMIHSPVNVAMLYLADELFRNTNKTFTITIGKPIPWQTFDKSKTPLQWAEYVRNKVYEL